MRLFKKLAIFAILATLCACEGEKSSPQKANDGEKSAENNASSAIPSSNEAEWFYQAYLMKDGDLFIYRVKFESEKDIQIEEYLFNPAELYKTQYRVSSSELSKNGSKWTMSDQKITCGEKETVDYKISFTSDELSFTNDDGATLHFKKDPGYFRELFKQVMITSLDSSCSMLEKYTSQEAASRNIASLPPFHYDQYKRPEWSEPDKEIVNQIVSSVQCQNGKRLEPVTFHFENIGENNILKGESVPGPHQIAPSEAIYVGLSSFSDIMFIQKIPSTNSYNVTLSYCPQKANGFEFLGNGRAMTGFGFDNGIILHESQCGDRPNKVITSAQNTSVQLQSYDVVLNGGKVTVPSISSSTTFYQPNCN